ncbi:MAG: hypothetical protein JSV80_13750 [Acidobacteriota bacterium]|nr:MAG: hypothetical protein JSV80_13750 [Acidobacteriota bacterium]
MRSKTTHLGAILAGVALATGCLSFRGPEDVRRDLTRVTGVSYQRETAVGLGPMLLGVVRWVAADEPDASLPAGLRRLEVGVYKPRRETQERRQLRGSDFPGWMPLLEVTSGSGDAALVLIEMKRDVLRKMLVVAQESDELVIVRLSGDFSDPSELIRFVFDDVDEIDWSESVVNLRDRASPDPASG